MRIAADACHALEGEIERGAFEAGAREEGDQEGAEAAVDVQREAFAQGEIGERGDVVDDAMREVWCRADEQDRVAVYEPRDGGHVRAIAGGRAGDEVHADLEVGAGFAEGGVGGFGEDPGMGMR